MGFNDLKEFDDPQVFNDPKGISIGTMDFDNPKVYDDTSITDGLVHVEVLGLKTFFLHLYVFRVVPFIPFWFPCTAGTWPERDFSSGALCVWLEVSDHQSK